MDFSRDLLHQQFQGRLSCFDGRLDLQGEFLRGKFWGVENSFPNIFRSNRFPGVFFIGFKVLLSWVQVFFWGW